MLKWVVRRITQYRSGLDIDVDYLPAVRSYLKETFAPKCFGEEFCCNIANYNTYGLKSALLDMTRVFGGERNDILRITTTLGLKDDEGSPLTWEKAVDLYPELKQWADKHWWADLNGEQIRGPAQAAKNLLAADIDWAKYDYKGEPPHRIRSIGMHAGGLIIANQPISDMVPLVRGKDGARASAWTEGLHSQELSLVGYVKLDYLVIDALTKIALCIKFIRERHPEIHKICATPGGPNFSDTSYLNDPKCLKVANEGDLKMIFQFDSEGIRELARKGGITSFDDIQAYTALYRPGPMDVGMHEKYVARKRGKESYELHPVLEPILGKSYGVMVYQEDVMKVLNIVGDIPMKECQPIIKAISKKKLDKFEKFKALFIKNGQKTLGWEEPKVADLWDQIESFAGYGFNQAHATSYSILTARQLYLKVHYPLEYITAVLCCLKTGDDRLREYKLDAEKHNVGVHRADINKSKENFAIVDEKIYWGLSKIKGIGDEVASEIVNNQPYADFVDFLKRFGTDGTVLKPVLGLRLFNDQAATDLYKFYLKFKDKEKKSGDRTKRYEKAKAKLNDDIIRLLGMGPDTFSWDDLEDRARHIGPEKVDELKPLRKKYERCVSNYEKKVRGDEAESLADMGLDDIEDDEIGKDLLTNLSDEAQGEMAYYGFIWEHPVTKSPDYTKDATFENHRLEESKGTICAPVEVLIHKVNHNKSKKGTVYHQLEVEDAHFERNRVNVWNEEYERFKDVLVEGELVRLRLNPPSGGFKTYTLESYPKWKKVEKVAKEHDWRVIQLAK